MVSAVLSNTVSADLLLSLAQHHHDPEARARLADQIGTLLLTKGTDQNGHAGAILTSRLPRLEERMRAYLSKRLAPLPTLPHALVRRLAEDVIRVAYPVLLDSPLLTQEDLVSIISAQGPDHRLAIAQRAQISEIVTAALVAHGPESVVIKALRNPTARFSEETFRVTACLARQSEAIQIPLGRRDDLPATIAQEILSFVSDEVKAEILRRLQPKIAFGKDFDPSLKTQILAAIERRRSVDGPLLLSTLRTGALHFFEILLALSIGTTSRHIQHLLTQVPHRLLPCVAVLLGLSSVQLSHLWLYFRQAYPSLDTEGMNVASILSTYGTLTCESAQKEIQSLLSFSEQRCSA